MSKKIKIVFFSVMLFYLFLFNTNTVFAFSYSPETEISDSYTFDFTGDELNCGTGDDEDYPNRVISITTTDGGINRNYWPGVVEENSQNIYTISYGQSAYYPDGGYYINLGDVQIIDVSLNCVADEVGLAYISGDSGSQIIQYFDPSIYIVAPNPNSSDTATSALATIMSSVVRTTISIFTMLITTYWPYVLVIGAIIGLIKIFGRFTKHGIGSGK